jgi:molybdate transport system substrate-binding protein
MGRSWWSWGRSVRRWLLVATLTAGCNAPDDAAATHPRAGPRAEPAAILRVAAASDLQAALPALVERYRRAHPVDVQPAFGSSGQLAAQIRQGAPFDLFLSADLAFVRDLAADGTVQPESVRPYTRGALVLAVHPEAGAAIAGLADLARPEVKAIALANPDFAPYGQAGRQALERAGLWDTVHAKVVRAETVRQALQFVETGNAEAGLVGRAIAAAPGVRVIDVDPALYDPIIQGLGIVAEAPHAEEARAFADFLTGADGQAVLARFGFQEADAPESSSRPHP